MLEYHMNIKDQYGATLMIALVCAAAVSLTGCLLKPDYGEPPDLTRFNETVVGDCDPYTQSTSYRGRGTTVIVYPQSDWISTIENAGTNTEILFDDGDYILDKRVVNVKAGLTIRSVNGNREKVRIRGLGYGFESQGFLILGNDVTIADISIENIRDHAVAVNPASGAMQDLQLYNLSLVDIGTQHIKVNPGGARDGLIACSSIGYTEGGAVGDYNGAIDLHGTLNWTVRDNTIYNITGDGSGCLIDEDCGRYASAPAILAWQGASGTRVIGNTITGSFRNIAFGLGATHFGGAILHNNIRQSAPGDAGIELFDATDAVVEFNTVELKGNYPGTIEYRGSSNLTITNNWLSARPWNRGGNVNITLSGNAFRIPE